jgi:hypothetical protein
VSGDRPSVLMDREQNRNDRDYDHCHHDPIPNHAVKRPNRGT